MRLRHLARFAIACAVAIPGRDGFGRQDSSSPASPDPATFEQQLEALARMAPAPAPSPGDLRLSGRIVTDRGEPLAGVIVRMTFWPEPTGWRRSNPISAMPPPPRDLAESLHSSVRSWQAQRAGSRESVSDADGRYEMAELAAGQYEIGAWKEGFELLPRSQRIRGSFRLRTDAVVEFVATPTAVQRFVLRGADGTPPADAQLLFERVGSNEPVRRQVTWTPADPSTPMSVGDWRVTAAMFSDDHHVNDASWARFASSPRLLSIDPKKLPEPVTLELREVPAIQGTVGTNAGPYVSYQVSAIELEPQQSPDPSMFGVAARSRGMTKFGRPVNAQIMFYGDFFDYRITGLKPGRWYVGVTRYELPAALATAVVEVSTGCVVQDFVLPEPTTPTLSVRVLAPDGAPLHDCEFRVHSQFRGPDGRFSGGIAGAIASQADVGPVFRISTERFADRTTLFAVHPRFGSVPIEVTPDRREYEARFADPAIVTLRLEDFAEHARGRVVTLERRRTGVDEPFPPLPAIPSTGIVELGATQPGTWRFEFVADSDVTDSVSGRPVFAATVELAAGEREITLPFPRLEDVRVSVPNDDRGRITFEPDDGTPDERSRWGLQGETDADLVATIRGVPPGSWIVSTRRGRKMRLQTPVSGVVRFVPTAVRAMRVSITDPSGPIAKAGLATGDLVVAFSGFEFDGQEELYRVLQRLSGEQLTLTVERAGERFEVVIPRKLWSDSSSGARFEEHVR